MRIKIVAVYLAFTLFGYSFASGIPSDILSPYKQFKSGVKAEEVVCKSGLQLVMKKSNGYPLCIKGTSSKKLTERKFIPEYNGWDSEIPVDKFITNQTKN